jgi:hypothetical protein
MLTFERMVDIGDGLYNVASSAAYYHIYVAMFCAFKKIIIAFYISILLLSPPTSKQCVA